MMCDPTWACHEARLHRGGPPRRSCAPTHPSPAANTRARAQGLGIIRTLLVLPEGYMDPSQLSHAALLDHLRSSAATCQGGGGGGLTVMACQMGAGAPSAQQSGATYGLSFGLQVLLLPRGWLLAR